MLVGDDCTASFVGGPCRLGKSQFSLAKLPYAALVLFPDMPAPPGVQGLAMEQYLEGLGVIKCLTGGDPITVEQKYRDVITVKITPACGSTPTFRWADSCTGGTTLSRGRNGFCLFRSHSSSERRRREQGYERRFAEELPQIAWYAIESFAEVKQRRGFTWSREMLLAQMRMSQGTHGRWEGFFKLLYAKPGSWLSRAEVKSAAERVLGEELDHGQLTSLYRYCRTIDGVSEKKRQGFLGFKNLAIQDWPPEG